MLTYRFADENDCGKILEFIRALAAYEKMSDEVVATEELLREWIFENKKAEDLFVLPEYRGRGYGTGLLKKLAQIAVERGCGRLEWWCLDWNQPSIDLYRSLGAEPMDEWTTYRLAGETLEKMAQ